MREHAHRGLYSLNMYQSLLALISPDKSEPCGSGLKALSTALTDLMGIAI
jgi:hypothetical protein